jgi:hypothetical protein
MRKAIPILFLALLTFCSFSQSVFEPVVDSPVYELLDELVTLKVIPLNSVIKPYSRVFIAEKLSEAQHSLQYQNHQLPERIRQEIDFYLIDYKFDLLSVDSVGRGPLPHHKISIVPPGYSYISSPFRAAIRPAFGADWMVNGKGSAWNIEGGAEVFGYITKHLGFYLNMQQTLQSEALVDPLYFTLEEGKVWSDAGNGKVTNTEWRGGMSFGWKWGDLGVYKDRPVWGNAEHGSNILSGHAPSRPFIQLHLFPAKWIDFTYIHVWLNSDVVDSSRSTFATNNSEEENSIVYRKKYLAANMLTVIPWRGLNISLGNSIIYSDINPDPYYLIPVLFYNSVDAEKNLYQNNNGSNSQFFFDISSRQIRHLSLYVTLYIDELKVSRIFDPEHFNFTSWKFGMKLADFPLQNLSFSAEWTRTNPLTYKHFIETTDFTSDMYNMGSWLRDNSQEIWLALTYKPIRGLSVQLSWEYGEHGAEYVYSNNTGVDLTTLPVLKNLTWKNNQLQMSVRYQVLNRISCYLQYSNDLREGDTGYEPSFMHGNTNTLCAGISLGWE